MELEPLYLSRKHGASISHRFSPATLATLTEADMALKRSGELRTAAARRALDRRLAGLRSWTVREEVGADLKARRVGPALLKAIGRPHAWPLLARLATERRRPAPRPGAPAGEAQLAA